MLRFMGGAVVAALLLTLACGTSDKDPSQGSAGQAAGGTAHGGASNAGMNTGGNGAGQAGKGGSPAGAGGTLMLGNSPAEACIAYGLAVCSRQVQCSNVSLEVWPVPSCIAVTYECPDLSFSPGATRTVAGLLACA